MDVIMESLSSIDIFEVPKITNFLEFNKALQLLDELYDMELYTEARVDRPKEALTSKVGDALEKTADGTKKTLKAYDDVTDGGGAFLSGVANIVYASIGLIAKVLKFIFENLGKIPKMIGKLISNISNIPDTVRAKLSGNIQLYITAGDLERFYNETFPQISNFVSLGKDMSEGSVWKTFFNSIKDVPNIKIADLTTNDVKTAKKMKEIYNKLHKIEFEHSTIELKNDNNVNIYFGNEQSIEFRDIKGNIHKSTYMDAISTLCKDLELQKNPLEEIYKQLGAKYEASQLNSSLARLSNSNQKYITDGIQMVSKVLAVLGNLIKYVLLDVKTIQLSCDKILAKHGASNKTPVNNKP